MTLFFRDKQQAIMEFALCLLVGIAAGVILLYLPDKAVLGALAALGAMTLIFALKSSRQVVLFTLSAVVPFYFGKDFYVRTEDLSLENTLGIHLTDVLTLALLIIFLARLAKGQATIHFFRQITVPAFAWLIASSLSLLPARDIDAALLELISMVKLFLLFLVVANSIEEPQDLKWLIAGLITGLMCQGLVGVYQGVTGHPLGLYFLGEISTVRQQQLDQSLIYRVQGTIGHPNAYAMYVTSLMPFALAILFIRTKILFKIFAGSAFLVGSAALIFSLSRSAWVGFVVVVLLVLVFAVRQRRLNIRSAVLITATTALLICTIAFFGWERISLRLMASDRGSAASRITLSEGALAVVQDYPILGVGLNNYSFISAKYDPIDFESWHRAPIVHNVPLLIAAETGIVGLLAFITFIASLLFLAWRIPGAAPDETQWVAGVGLFCAFVSLALHGMADYAFLADLNVSTLFWLLAGMCAAVALRSSQVHQIGIARDSAPLPDTQVKPMLTNR